MKCVFCGFEDSKVIDSRGAEDLNSIRRRRECLKCGRRFTTYETVESVPILVIKSNGSRQPLDIQKIKRGIIKACEKRPITLSQIEEVVSGIEKKITNSLDQEVSSSYIGELVMEGLRPLDEIAYVRFAAVYRKFKDISTFKSFINQI